MAIKIVPQGAMVAACKNVIPELTEQTDGTVTLSDDRYGVLLASSWELDALAELLPTLTDDDSAEALNVGYRVRCIASRIKELASIQMSGLSDDAHKTEDLMSRLTCKKLKAGAA